jgi:hypothetical protein
MNDRIRIPKEQAISYNDTGSLTEMTRGLGLEPVPE